MESKTDDPLILMQVLDPEREVCDWLDNNVDEKLSINKLSVEKLCSWMKTGKRIQPGQAESHQFCSPNSNMEVATFKEKNGLNNFDRKSILWRCNPYDTIDRAGFKTRTAVKAANLDFMIKFTRPLDQQDKPLTDVEHKRLFYSDVYRYTHSFAEYIEWCMRNQTDKIITQLGLSSIFQRDQQSGYYDLPDPRTVDTYIECARKSDTYTRLHLLTVDYYPDSDDTGLSTELLHKHSNLRYCILALTLLRPNGTFIMKMYKSQELFTVGLLYLMYRCFDKISLVKPNSCRPGNSERYLICKWKKSNDQTANIRRYLYDVYDKLNELIGTNEDVMQLIPIDVLEANKTFLDYIHDKNDKILHNFLLTWQCIKRYSDVELVDKRQNDFKERCFRLWDLKASADNWRRNDDRPVPRNYQKYDNWRSRKE